jgi:arsenate reductase
MGEPYRILFMSRRNAARSLMAEAVVNRHGKGKFCAVSAGVEPSKDADPIALSVIEQAGYATNALHPKHWREFAGSEAPFLDFVFTLSGAASAAEFPEWPGKPVAAQWLYDDPLAVSGDDWQRRRAYMRILASIERQMRIFMQLPLASLDHLALHKNLQELAKSERESV